MSEKHLKSDGKGRYLLKSFLPDKSEVAVTKHNDGSVTLRPVGRRRRMTPGQVKDYIKSRSGTWDGRVTGAELLKMTRGYR